MSLKKKKTVGKNYQRILIVCQVCQFKIKHYTILPLHNIPCRLVMCALLYRCSGSVTVFWRGVRRYDLHGYPPSPRRYPLPISLVSKRANMNFGNHHHHLVLQTHRPFLLFFLHYGQIDWDIAYKPYNYWTPCCNCIAKRSRTTGYINNNNYPRLVSMNS